MVDMKIVAGCALIAAAFGYMVFGSIGVVFALGAGVFFCTGPGIITPPRATMPCRESGRPRVDQEQRRRRTVEAEALRQKKEADLANKRNNREKLIGEAPPAWLTKKKEARRRARLAAEADLAATNTTMPRHVSRRSAEAQRRKEVEQKANEDEKRRRKAVQRNADVDARFNEMNKMKMQSSFYK